MISTNTTEKTGSEQLQNSLPNLGSRASVSPESRAFGKPRSIFTLLRAFVHWQRKARYADTGESGEAYDAEMEAANAES